MCYFSHPARQFFELFVAYAVQNLSKKELGSFLREVHDDLRLNEHDLQHYALVLRPILTKHLWEIPVADFAEVSRVVWGVKEPPPRKVPIGCRSHLVQILASTYVRHFQTQTTIIASALMNVSRPLMSNGDGPDYRRLAVWLIQNHIEEDRADWTVLNRAWQLVRGTGPLKINGKEAQLPLIEDEDISKAVSSVVEHDTEFQKFFPGNDALQERSYEQFKERFKGARERPYMCLYRHPKFGLLLVMCAINGLNSKNQVVYAGGKYGHSGEPEVPHKHWESVIGTGVGQDPSGAHVKTKALPYVEGGYGSFWINIVDESKPKNDRDVFKAFFILKNEQIYLVDEDVYQRRIKTAKRQKSPPADPIPTFDVTS